MIPVTLSIKIYYVTYITNMIVSKRLYDYVQEKRSDNGIFYSE